MNETRDDIWKEYRDADLNRRLHLYLQLPELRSDFSLIEQEERHGTALASSRRPDKICVAPGNLFGRKLSCFLKEAFAWKM